MDLLGNIIIGVPVLWGIGFCVVTLYKNGGLPKAALVAGGLALVWMILT